MIYAFCYETSRQKQLGENHILSPSRVQRPVNPIFGKKLFFQLVSWTPFTTLAVRSNRNQFETGATCDLSVLNSYFQDRQGNISDPERFRDDTQKESVLKSYSSVADFQTSNKIKIISAIFKSFFNSFVYRIDLLYN